MRIISGKFKGRPLASPKSKLIRPAFDRVRESVFSILEPLSDLNVLDLYAGTGSVGLEALSRGARFVTFVDHLNEAITLLGKNIAACQCELQTQIIKAKLPQKLGLVKKFSPFDLIFVDPPYDQDLVNPSLDALIKNNIIDADGLIVVEHSPRELIASSAFAIDQQRKYGQTLMSFLRPS